MIESDYEMCPTINGGWMVGGYLL